MEKSALIDRTSFVVAGFIFLITLILFYQDTGMFLKCVGAALINAVLVWVSYITIRWIYLAIKS